MKYTILCAALILSGITAHAADLDGTLKKIKDSGTITLGVRDFSVPFSFIDDKQAYQGYAIDLCLHIANTAQKALGLSTLNIKMVPVTSSSRMPLLANGTIDLECGNTTNNIERQAIAGFSPTMFVSSNRFITKKQSNIQSIKDLSGKTVAASSGTSNLANLIKLNKEQNLSINIVTVPDTAEGFLMLEHGRAVAYVGDDIILATLAAGSKTPSDYVINNEPLSIEPYGLLLRKNDPTFKKVTDETIARLYQSGEINKIYAKWFQSPIPPKNINLNWKISPELQAVIAKPTNSGDPADYALQ